MSIKSERANDSASWWYEEREAGVKTLVGWREDGHHVFPMIDTEVEERGFKGEGFSDHCTKEPSIGLQSPGSEMSSFSYYFINKFGTGPKKSFESCLYLLADLFS